MGPTHSEKVDTLTTLYPDVHRSTLELVPYFEYGHLPEHLKDISRPFHELVDRLLNGAAQGALTGPELTVAIRKLLEAKDCAVRSAL